MFWNTIVKFLQCIAIVWIVTLSTVVQGNSCNYLNAPTTPNSRFTLYPDGSVLDLKTGLIWERCIEGYSWNDTEKKCEGNVTSMSWIALMDYVEEKNQGIIDESKKWRVPNIKELSSIVERSCWGPALNVNIFLSGRHSELVWSSTQIIGSSSKVYMIDFDYGRIVNENKYDSTYFSGNVDEYFNRPPIYVRLVRTSL